MWKSQAPRVSAPGVGLRLCGGGLVLIELLAVVLQLELERRSVLQPALPLQVLDCRLGLLLLTFTVLGCARTVRRLLRDSLLGIIALLLGMHRLLIVELGLAEKPRVRVRLRPLRRTPTLPQLCQQRAHRAVVGSHLGRHGEVIDSAVCVLVPRGHWLREGARASVQRF